MNKDKKRCPSCNSLNIYARTKTNDFVCKVCGHQFIFPNLKRGEKGGIKDNGKQ